VLSLFLWYILILNLNYPNILWQKWHWYYQTLKWQWYGQTKIDGDNNVSQITIQWSVYIQILLGDKTNKEDILAKKFKECDSVTIIYIVCLMNLLSSSPMY